MRRTAQSISILLTALAITLSACAPKDGDAVPAATSLETASQRGIFGVGVTTFDLVDHSRSTEPNRDFPGADKRELTVELWYPADPSAGAREQRDAKLDRSDAPYPLIVFAHGYIVAAPDFPLSRLDAPGGPRLRAVLNQPEDVSFLIDRLLMFNEQSGHLLAGAIDGGAIGVSGHSLGALTTLLAAYGPQQDARVRAILPIAPPGCFLPDNFAGAVSLPLLVLGGTKDLITPPAGNRRAYEVSNPPRYLVELAGADHIRFADVSLEDTQLLEQGILSSLLEGELASDGLQIAQSLGSNVRTCQLPGESGPSDDPLLTAERQRELLRTVAIPFFDAYLRGSEAAAAFLQSELDALLPEVSIEFELE